LLRPRPVPILSGRVFQARAERLLSSVQKLLALPASGKGLRRTLDRLAQQVQPANPIPSLSETGRQQLAEAAAQVKVLLREPLPAHMHAALRALQGKLLGQAQGRPDLKAMQRISTQANTLLTSQLKGKAAPKTPEKELSIYVQNAGLVLLWPFIPRFFQNLGLVEGREFVSPEAHARAVLFLQYLADPDPETAEHLLPLCKLLCGYPDDRPIHLELLPSDEEIAACEGLLATVPGHHPAMKNMRVEGFRTAWLQREGALKPRGDHHLLHVEKQAYDILLEQLPWSIRVIRLPWMHTAILTEW
jgi:Contractile injection system tape measure protein